MPFMRAGSQQEVSSYARSLNHSLGPLIGLCKPQRTRHSWFMLSKHTKKKLAPTPLKVFFSNPKMTVFPIIMSFLVFFIHYLVITSLCILSIYLLSNISHISHPHHGSCMVVYELLLSSLLCCVSCTCSDISMSTRSFLMPIQTRFPLSCCAMLARSLSVKLPSSYKDNKDIRKVDIFNTTFETSNQKAE